MKRYLKHISVLLAALTVLFVSCRKDEAEVIPRNQLAKIYAEMLLTDQWISDTPGLRQVADTSLVYEPILKKYGYTTEDYLKTVNVYMDDPERFSRIFRSTVEILDKKLISLKKEKEIQDMRVAREKELEKMLRQIKPDFKPEEFFPYLFDEPYVHYYDSLAVEPDSVLMIYRMLSIERADTLYDEIRMIIQSDSLTVSKDSIPEIEKEKPVEQIGKPALENSFLKGEMIVK